MTCVLLDTNAYLRLAKRIQPLLGVPFGQKGYVLTILKDVEDEVRRNPSLQLRYPWFDDHTLATERLAQRVRLSRDESARIKGMCSVLREHVQENATSYTAKGRSPPSYTDCYCLAFGQVRTAIVATDDLGMHKLASEFNLPVWHRHELLKKMLTAKVVDRELVVEICTALENNDDRRDRQAQAGGSRPDCVGLAACAEAVDCAKFGHHQAASPGGEPFLAHMQCNVDHGPV